MKKLLAIMVLGLLFSGNASAETYKGQHGTYIKGTDKKSFCKSELKNKVFTRSQFCVSASPYFKRGIEVMDGWDSLRIDNQELHFYSRYAIFTNVTKARTKFCGFIPYSCLKKSGDGKLYALARTWSDVEAILDEIDPIRAEAKKKEEEEKKIAEVKKKEEERKIAQAKKKEEEKKIVKKPKEKKTTTKAPEIDGSLLTIGSGSGFYINSKGYALTNNHVVDICKQMVAVVDGREILFRVLNTDKTNDVAIIKTDQRSPNFIKINEDGAKLGEDIIAVGYPLSGRLSDSVKITRGIVSALSGMNNNSGQIQIDAALQPGNSGGPVINESGELIGIASAGLNKLLMAKEAKYIPENVNFAVSSLIVTNILKNKKVSYSTPSFFSGSYSNTELATLGDKVTLQLFCRNTRTAYNKLKRSKQYSHILIDLD